MKRSVHRPTSISLCLGSRDTAGLQDSNDPRGRKWNYAEVYFWTEADANAVAALLGDAVTAVVNVETLCMA